LQVSRAADPETLQSQLAKTARKRLSLSGLELLHGRLNISKLVHHSEHLIMGRICAWKTLQSPFYTKLRKH
jgi:hypothetical protein